MRNIVVQALCRIKPNHAKQGQDIPLQQGDIYDTYKQVQQISYNSHRKNIQGDWQYVLLQKDLEHPFEIFENTFRRVAELWLEGDTNILFFGLDTMTIKPTDIFEQFEDFMMFNYTDPKTNSVYKHNFNCDVRYYPATMSNDLVLHSLEQCDKLVKWEDEQNIYNHMLWSQPNRNIENTLHPHLAYQGANLLLDNWQQRKEYENKWNGIQLKDAHIVHLHTSRDVLKKLELMKQLEKLI